MNKNLWLLALAQGFFLTNNVTFIGINGLVGLELAPYGWMATLPVMVLATGIGVDYAFYIYNRLLIHLSRNEDMQTALTGSLREVGIATDGLRARGLVEVPLEEVLGELYPVGKEFVLPTFGSGKVATKDIAIFFRQFSVMIDAGLPLVQCLEILGANQENTTFQKVLADVRGRVEGGSTLANALREHPKVFDQLVVNMVEAGETGGILDTILQRLSVYVEKAVKLKAAVKSALIYPVAVVSVAVIVVGLLLWKLYGMTHP